MSGFGAQPGVKTISRADPAFALRVVWVGASVTFVLGVASFAYALLTWSQPHRLALVLISAAALLDAAVIVALRRHLVASGRIEALFAGWNVAHVDVAGVACSLDGGPDSPYVLILFVSVAFAAVSLPRTYVGAISALDIAALFGIAALTDSWPQSLVVLAAALFAVTFVCAAVAGERHARLQ